MKNKVENTSSGKSQHSSHTHLQAAQCNRTDQSLQKSVPAPTQKEFQNIFSNASKKNKTPDTQAATTKTLKRSVDNGLQGRPRRTPAGNTGLAKVAVQCSADTFVVNHPLASGLRINPLANGW